jgi:hypothetical protein
MISKMHTKTIAPFISAGRLFAASCINVEQLKISRAPSVIVATANIVIAGSWMAL